MLQGAKFGPPPRSFGCRLFPVPTTQDPMGSRVWQKPSLLGTISLDKTTIFRCATVSVYALAAAPPFSSLPVPPSPIRLRLKRVCLLPAADWSECARARRVRARALNLPPSSIFGWGGRDSGKKDGDSEAAYKEPVDYL